MFSPRLWKTLFLLVVVLAPAVAQESPKTMTKLEVLLQSPDAPAGSFAAKPKVMYRAGTKYCRIEEAADTENGVQNLAIINEPDYWMVNLLNKTGHHAVDPGPTYNCHLPIFPETDRNLEFGLEMEYFMAKGAMPHPGPVLQTKSTTVYKVDVGNSVLALFTYGSPDRPLAMSRVQGDKNEIFWFSGYGQLKFDPALFSKPDGLKIQEQK